MNGNAAGGARDTGDIPEEVTHAMIFISERARSRLVKRIVHGVDFGGIPNCHALARIYAFSLPYLEVVDGAVVTLGRKGVTPRYHSWLRFKSVPRYGVDVSPLGAVPILTSPNLLYFDDHCLFEETPVPHDALRIDEAMAFSRTYESVFRDAIAEMRVPRPG